MPLAIRGEGKRWIHIFSCLCIECLCNKAQESGKSRNWEVGTGLGGAGQEVKIGS